jgi:hypothetical protein
MLTSARVETDFRHVTTLPATQTRAISNFLMSQISETIKYLWSKHRNNFTYTSYMMLLRRLILYNNLQQNRCLTDDYNKITDSTNADHLVHKRCMSS